MQLKYGKVKFGYKDSFSAEPVLSDIIVAWLKNFKYVITREDKKHFVGCPHNVLTELYPNQPVDQHFSNEQIEKGRLKLVEYIDKMIYGFEDHEPDISEYDIKTEAGYKKFLDDMGKYDETSKECRMLFAEYFNYLWW